MRDYQYVVTLDVVNSDSLKKIEKKFPYTSIVPGFK